METEDVQSGSIAAGTLWMLGLTVLLFWLPALGPLVAGYVGGRRTGNVGGAAILSIFAAALSMGLFLLAGSGLGFPLLDELAGAGVLIILLFASVPLIAAAIVGAATAKSASWEDQEA